MKIALTGSSGFIATHLQKALFNGNANFAHLKRNQSDLEWKELINNADVVINLAGAPVIQRWTVKNRKTIEESRTLTTRRLVNILNQIPASQVPKLLISASAIGIYPNDSPIVHDEQSNETGDSFLSEVVGKWEQEARELTNYATRLVIMRIGVVLGKEGGLIAKVLPLFRLGLGGRIGNGNQTLSFIHIDDIVNAVQFFIENKNSTGTYNLVAPNITTNELFTRVLAKKLKRKAVLPVPAFALKLLYGQAAQIMIKGENVYPAHLLADGFRFKYPNIGSAIEAVL
jgi:uncharacterized protein